VTGSVLFETGSVVFVGGVTGFSGVTTRNYFSSCTESLSSASLSAFANPAFNSASEIF
jgi:hypothetical protein